VYFSCVSQFQNPPNYLLRIAGRELQGTIPKYIGLLYDRLEVLDLGNNSLIGTIPIELRNLKSLKELRLDHNNLSGVIPGEIFISTEENVKKIVASSEASPSNQSNDRLLKKQNNNVISSLPPAANHRGLKSDKATRKPTRNPTRAPILASTKPSTRPPSSFPTNVPTESDIGQTWEVLDLSHNNFNGTIPSEISFLRSLTHLILDNNTQLEGNISCTLLSKLEEGKSVCQGFIPPSMSPTIKSESPTIIDHHQPKPTIDGTGTGSIGANLTSGSITAIAVVASCVLLLLFLCVVCRNRLQREDNGFRNTLAFQQGVVFGEAAASACDSDCDSDCHARLASNTRTTRR